MTTCLRKSCSFGLLCVSHRRRKVLNIGSVCVGGTGARFRTQGGQLSAGCKLTGAPAPNQCQTITFLTLKTDNIAKLKIALKSILSEIHVTSNKR